MKKIIFFVGLITCLIGCEDDNDSTTIRLVSAFVGSDELDLNGSGNTGLPRDRAISLTFSGEVDETSAELSVQLLQNGSPANADIAMGSQANTVTIFPAGLLKSNTTYVISVSESLKGARGQEVEPAEISFTTELADLMLLSGEIAGIDIEQSTRIQNVPVAPVITLNFSVPLDVNELNNAIFLVGTGQQLQMTFSNENKTVTMTPESSLEHFSKYELEVSRFLKGANGEIFEGFSREFYTVVDETPKFPVISDDELLTLVQQQTFKYFWDFAEPVSGMARERNTSGSLVTSGGSGFGLMAIIVAIERNFITRQQGMERLDRILSFLETADRFHGAWSHWIDGTTGDVIPFSANDNGGDLVETSYLVQGLLAFRQYLDMGVAAEAELIDRINALWKSVEWNWYTRNDQDVLYWHWSPDKEWTMNHRIEGYNECLITYVLAASSPDHPISSSVYHQGWTRNGAMQNGSDYYGVTLPLGPSYGGPLFFAHYSFLGLDPRNLSDDYADYWVQNVNHSLINHQYCVTNPKDFVGYSDDCWGLTASDNHQGYSAHSPTNDLGVITPTAALSSMPYTPEASIRAMEFFYYRLGDRVWGEYGFIDAFNPTEEWYADSYLAIDQGPVVVMIENYRTGLLWDLFMSCPEVQNGLDKLGFTY